MTVHENSKPDLSANSPWIIAPSLLSANFSAAHCRLFVWAYSLAQVHAMHHKSPQCFETFPFLPAEWFSACALPAVVQVGHLLKATIPAVRP